jgi:hypothetical protein
VPATRERSCRLQSCNAICHIPFACCDGLRMCQVTVKWLHLLGEYEFPDGLTGGDELGVNPRSGNRISDAIVNHSVIHVMSNACLCLRKRGRMSSAADNLDHLNHFCAPTPRSLTTSLRSPAGLARLPAVFCRLSSSAASAPLLRSELYRPRHALTVPPYTGPMGFGSWLPHVVKYNACDL